MKKQNMPRVPTEQEKEELAKAIYLRSLEYFQDEEELQAEREMVAEAYIAVFDHYITSSVGYAGKVMVVVWDTSPEYYELYAWRQDGSLFRYQRSANLV